jgi:hypothetical protein
VTIMDNRLIGCCAVMVLGFAGLGQATAGLLSYEGFETGAGHYTAGSALPGQSCRGTGQASGGVWSGDDAADSSIQAVGLKHVVASKGGRAKHSGNGGSGTRVSLDLSAGGTFGAAGMVDGGSIGGGAVTGVLYVSFLTRSSYPSDGTTEPRYAGLMIGRGDTEIQSLGGNHGPAWAYSIFGASGNQDLLANGVAGTYIGVDTVTRLFVAKITYHAGAADDLTVWLDPDPAAGDAQGTTVRSYSGTGIADLSFDNLRLRAGDDGATDAWDFDEIRIGTDWASVTPATTEALASDSFPTGTAGYTAGAVLPGQNLLGAGHASGATWIGDDPNDSTVASAGLFYPGIASSGGKVVHSGNDGSTGTGTRGNLDVSAEGPLSLAGLVDAGNGIIGAGNASGPLYVSFLIRASNTSAAEPRWAGLTLYNGNTQVQSLGGNGLGPHAYSIFGRTGVQDLMTNRVIGSWIMVDRDPHLFVAKITYRPAANDDITVWLDPNPANGDSQAMSVRNYAGTNVSDFAFNNYRFQAGTTNSVTDPWEFDEVRFGRTWASVTPARTNELYAYEPFETGPGHYTENANLPGQTLGGTGHASGLTWTASAAGDSTVSPTGLAHIVASLGGMAVHSGLTSTNSGTGTRAALDLGANGPFNAAGLVSGGALGGGSVAAPLYVSFLARSRGTSAQEPRFAGLVTYRNGTRVQSLGGNGLPQHAYSSYGTFDADLVTNNVGSAWRGVNTDTHLFVAKIGFRADATDDITLWLDPDPADGDNQGPSVYLRSGASVGDLSFDSYELQAGPDGASDTWEFDEVRIGNSWASVTPAPAVPSVFSRESFKGYAGGDLAGQLYRGTGYAPGGAWSGAGAASFALPTLTHAIGWPIAGKAAHAGSGIDLLASLNAAGGGPFGQARLIDFATGTIGGGTVYGVLYVGFLARAQFPAGAATEDTPNDGASSALQLKRGTVDVQSLGGNPWSDWAYGLFGASGEVALRDSFGAGASLNYNTSTRLFVAKITYHAYANDDLTVWMDPSRADGDSQGAGVYMYSAAGVGDLSFNAYALRSGNDPADNGWDFDEVRFAPTFDGALPPAKPEIPLGTMMMMR